MKTIFCQIFISLFVCLLPLEPRADRHPFHLSVMEIEYSEIEKEWQIGLKVFRDDLEAGIEKRISKKIDYLNMPEYPETDLVPYLKSNISFYNPSINTEWQWLGIENEEEACWMYWSIPQNNVTSSSLKIDVRLFLDVFEDQVHLIHFKEKGKVKTVRLDAQTTQWAF